MRLPRRTAVRLLAGLLLVLALAGGLWWNVTRLNETERKLVGAWECVHIGDRYAVIFLADRRVFTIAHVGAIVDGDIVGSEWAYLSAGEKWDASPHSIRFRQIPAMNTRPSLCEWGMYLCQLWPGGDNRESRIDNLTDQSLTMGGTPHTRSTDENLQRLFRRLSGLSPD